MSKPIEPREIAASIVKVGESFAKGRGLPREVGITEIAEAVAYLGVEIFRGQDGVVYWRLPPQPNTTHAPTGAPIH